ncbi:MAG: fibrobacter succinogenes major paralogous domain-containing protein [Dysgonamonadaceae bacterium]|jgi:uncharacterized protein (TIGR02145 family)|nr:fibrobacter succinogenes major paralogous domain-containing protein [Dysgonamonadaceae bacterium]
MKKIFFLLAVLFASLVNKASAQVTIGQNVTPAATLDVKPAATAATAPGILTSRMTLTELNAAQSKYTAAQTGAFVYIYDAIGTQVPGYSDMVTCEGFIYWDGIQWISNCAVPKTYAKIAAQPKPFTFYELGTETEDALVFSATGSSAITYQWYKITGSNVHVRISEPCTAADGSGFNTGSFLPTVTVGTTRNAANTGFYEFYCVAKNASGDSVVSDVAEIAVGCGAKNLEGEWMPFMCFNLGASLQTIAAQKAASITHSDYNSSNGRYTYASGEENMYGDLYQWGRIGDGHEKRNSSVVAWASGSQPALENGALISGYNYPVNQVSRTDATFYGKFITSVSGNAYNWFPDINDVLNAQNSDLLWRSARFLPNDPCAHINIDGSTFTTYYPTTVAQAEPGTGWRMPEQEEWSSLFRGGTVSGAPSIAMANTWVWYDGGTSADTNGAKGHELKPDGNVTTLFLPAGGTRNSTSGNLYNGGSAGYYWSSTISGNSALGMFCSSGTVNPAYSGVRAEGDAIRCIKAK